MKNPNTFYLFLLFIVFTACEPNYTNNPGHRQAELRYEKAVKLHEYLQREVAALAEVKKNSMSVASVEEVSTSEVAVPRLQEDKMDHFNSLLRKQAAILKHQKECLQQHATQPLTIHQKEAQRNQIRQELKMIKLEVLEACSEINRLMSFYPHAKKNTPKLASIK